MSRRDTSRDTGVTRSREKHGHAANGRKTAEYTAWENMTERCRSPKHPRWPRYGGRGITVCDRWRAFANFLDDLGPRPSPAHSLERIDNDGRYEPGNVQWATRQQQAANKSSNRIVTIDGVANHLREWAKLFGVPETTARARLNRGWPPARAFSRDVAKVGPR